MTVQESVKPRIGRGRPISVKANKKFEAVEELILSHEDQLGSNKVQQKIAAIPEY